jgi:hypothetical protein
MNTHPIRITNLVYCTLKHDSRNGLWTRELQKKDTVIIKKYKQLKQGMCIEWGNRRGSSNNILGYRTSFTWVRGINIYDFTQNYFSPTKVELAFLENLWKITFWVAAELFCLTYPKYALELGVQGNSKVLLEMDGASRAFSATST